MDFGVKKIILTRLKIQGNVLRWQFLRERLVRVVFEIPKQKPLRISKGFLLD
jgi:hypothetical protein